MSRGVHIAPNGRGLGHNGKQVAVASAVKELFEKKGEEIEIYAITEARVLDLWEDFPVYRIPSPHDMPERKKEIERKNGEVIYGILKTLKPDYVAIDNTPRPVPEEVGALKFFFLRPYDYSGYENTSHEKSEKSWGGFDYFLIPTHPELENILDLDERWEKKKKDVEGRGGEWIQIGRIIPFKKYLDKLKGRKRKRGEILLAYGGGGLLNFKEGKHLERIVETTSHQYRLITGPYAEREFVRALKKKFGERLKVEEGFLHPREYARKLAEAEVVINPFGYNTQTMCFYLGTPVVSILFRRAMDKSRMNWAKKLEEAGATEVIYEGVNEGEAGRIIDKVFESREEIVRNASKFVEFDGGKNAAEIIYRALEEVL